MGLLSRWLSFERPMGPVLVQLVYLVGLLIISLRCLERMYMGLLMIAGRLGDVYGPADGVIALLAAPIKAVIAACLLRIVAELLRAAFRMDQSLREIVTGRAVPPSAFTVPASPDQSPD